jgi:hypothetical protein
MIGHHLGGPNLLHAEFGISMEIPSDLNHQGQNFFGFFKKGGHRYSPI